MKLVSFSVENYRSITTARKIPLSDYSLLIGANNEGKSNMLHALALGMDVLVGARRYNYRGRRELRVPPSLMLRQHGRMRYEWETDFPVSKQKEHSEGGRISWQRHRRERKELPIFSRITLEFKFDETETRDFEDEVKSELNDTLPLIISFGPVGSRDIDFSIGKPEKGPAIPNSKRSEVAWFISRRIDFEYIPAIRTSELAGRIISNLVWREMLHLRDNPEYSEAIAKVEFLQRSILDQFSQAINSTIKDFLPSVKSVKLESDMEDRSEYFRRNVEIVVDDGNPTRLERKGDGVQSLVALALMRYASEQRGGNGNTVIAIEEPESHLHSRAVHELREVIESLSEKNQVVLTSHSPLFVNPQNLKNTVIVKDSVAKEAKHISEIRDALGVRFSDNLHNARIVILVEGADDIMILNEAICSRSKNIKSALKERIIIFDPLNGASFLVQRAGSYQANACLVQCFIDNDKAGNAAVKRAIKAKALRSRDVSLCNVPSLHESELEDLYDKSIYAENFLKDFNVDVNKIPSDKNKRNKKWSVVVEKLFADAGVPWNKNEVKEWMSDFAEKNVKKIVKNLPKEPIDSFIQAIEAKLLDK